MSVIDFFRGAAAPASEVAEATSDLAEWTSPVVIDLLSAAYARAIPERPEVARAASRAHFAIWRKLLSGDVTQAPQGRRDLLKMAQTHGFDPATIGAVDRAVLVEVMECVLTRFQRSPHIASGYTLILLDAAACLAVSASQTRAAA